MLDGQHLPINPLDTRKCSSGFCTSATDVRPQVVLVPPKKVIPIIFIPGIMGSKQNARATGLGTWVKKLKVLRLDKRTVNDWHGEEMLLHIPSGNGKPSYHKFIFRSLSIGDDPLHPYVEMTLDTGVVDNQSASREPSLSDEEALALWDRLLNSIRVRPNAVAAGSRDSVQTEN